MSDPVNSNKIGAKMAKAKTKLTNVESVSNTVKVKKERKPRKAPTNIALKPIVKPVAKVKEKKPLLPIPSTVLAGLSRKQMEHYRQRVSGIVRKYLVGDITTREKAFLRRAIKDMQSVYSIMREIVSVDNSVGVDLKDLGDRLAR